MSFTKRSSNKTKKDYKKLLNLIKNNKVDQILFVRFENIVQVYPRYQINGLGCYNLEENDFYQFQKYFSKKFQFIDYSLKK